MKPHALADITVLDQFASQPFAPGWSADHRTFSSPADDVVGACEYAVSSATSTQILAMYSFTHPTLIEAFVAGIKGGIPTLCVLDSSQYTEKYEQAALASLMACVGMPNLRLSIGGSEEGSIMHRKVYIADGSVVVGGSFNWTPDATKEDNQCTIGIWPSDAASLTASVEATYNYQVAHHPQPKGASE